jgi:uncharacterized protein (TIGR03067 family)
MRTVAVLAVLAGAVGFAAADDKAKGIEGKYTLESGKKAGAAIDEKAKKAEYTISKDAITISSPEGKFVIKYKLDATATPNKIDLEITEGPEGAKGSKAEGIVELKGDVLKLAYNHEKGKRPTDYSGKEGHAFELKKAK